ncbi:MAG TPA: hypothetical protein PKW21_14110 [Rhabdaerophilum sp.]|nr:hypothetical protein [Rhabdaerophilum sp.]
MSRTAALSIAVTLAGCAVALAAPLEKQLPHGRAACWERTYDAAHLAAHPGQMVTGIKLAKVAESTDFPQTAVTLYINLRKRTAESDGGYDYSNTAFCKAAGVGLACENEYGLGRFRIEPAPNGGVIIRNPGIWANPNPYDAEEKADGAVSIPARPDDGSWLLDRKITANCPY